ncbi:MAG: hypothetical protein ACTSPN_10500 [Promethearchaeota archaeon]
MTPFKDKMPTLKHCKGESFKMIRNPWIKHFDPFLSQFIKLDGASLPDLDGNNFLKTILWILYDIKDGKSALSDYALAMWMVASDFMRESLMDGKPIEDSAKILNQGFRKEFNSFLREDFKIEILEDLNDQ